MVLYIKIKKGFVFRTKPKNAVADKCRLLTPDVMRNII